MKPLGMRYWERYDFYIQKDEFLESYSPQVCSWLRDQEYLVDFKYYENIENWGQFLHIFPKIR